jgi:citrate/tricarballylate utilization protein
MVVLFGGAFLYATTAMTMSFRLFWRDIGQDAARPAAPRSIWQAIKDAGQLRYLDGGGDGCRNVDDLTPDNRRLYHHFTFYGFLLCFASTAVATLYHYMLGREAPYAWYDLPVILGTVGGIGLTIGTLGLLRAKTVRDPVMEDVPRRGMDFAFTLMLLLTASTGLLLLLLRGTPAMGILLALHLGVVFSLFITMPYSKFVHGLYRFGALLRYAKDTRSGVKIVE